MTFALKLSKAAGLINSLLNCRTVRSHDATKTYREDIVADGI